MSQLYTYSIDVTIMLFCLLDKQVHIQGSHFAMYYVKNKVEMNIQLNSLDGLLSRVHMNYLLYNLLFVTVQYINK